MNKKIIWIIGGVVIGAAIVIAVVAMNNKSSTTPNSAASTSQNTTTQTPASTDVVTTKTDSNGNSYLADANGKSLYTYVNDQSGVSNCAGACIADWPIYDATAAPSTLPTNVAVITRADGGKQYTYKGLPLYTFSGDSANASPTGDGISGFSIAKP